MIIVWFLCLSTVYVGDILFPLFSISIFALLDQSLFVSLRFSLLLLSLHDFIRLNCLAIPILFFLFQILHNKQALHMFFLGVKYIS